MAEDPQPPVPLPPDQLGNLLQNLPDAREGEVTDVLLQTPTLRLERIVSHGQASPHGFWYDQAEGEWVCVLQGAGQLILLDPEETIDLRPGDYVWLAPHRRHRVAWTAPDQPTVWLAVFITSSA